MLSRKYYNRIAEIINGRTCVISIQTSRPGDYIFKEDLVEALATYFHEDNPNFNGEKFIEACNNG